MSKIERIVLHIGKRKTGSSSIQASLHGIDTEGFRYASLPKPNHSEVMIGLVPRLSERAGRYRYLSSPDEMQEVRAEQRRLLEQSLEKPARTLLFSAEALEKARQEEVSELVDYFLNFSDRVEVIGFVRPPRSSQISQFQERVKHGYVRPRLPTPSYRRTFEPYIQKLGASAVRVVAFEPKNFVEGSLVRTFLHAIGEPDVAFNEINRNEGMSADAIKILFAFNRLRGFPPKDGMPNIVQSNVWRSLAQEVKGGKLAFPAECHLQENLGADVEWLRATVGIDFTDDFGFMCSNAAVADALMEAEMSQVSDDGVSQFLEWMQKQTGDRPASLGDGLHCLYESLKSRRMTSIEKGKSGATSRSAKAPRTGLLA